MKASNDSVDDSSDGTGRHQPLLLGFVAAVFALGFVSLTIDVFEGDTGRLDTFVASAAQSLRAGQPWLGAVMRDLSGLGSTIVLTFVVVLTSGYLFVVRRRATAFMVAASAVLGALTVYAMKPLFGRVRPGSGFAEFVASGQSFPSGHATMSAAVFLTLGALVAGTRVRWQERTYIVGASIVLTAAVGLSRVVLGVHWATDVVAGWAFGTAWAALWLLVARRVQGR